MPNLTPLQTLSSRAIIGRFYQTFESEMKQGLVGKLAARFTSNQESETYKWLGQVPGVREFLGERMMKQLRASGVTIVNRKWESSLQIDVDDIRRDKTGQVSVRIDELAAKFADHPAKLLTDLIIQGENTTLAACHDGQALFSASHRYMDASDAGGAQINLLTNTQVPALNVATATAPTEQEMALAILNSIAYQFGYVDDAGDPINQQARSFAVLVPISLFGTALAAVSNAMLLGTGGASFSNPLKSTGWSIEVVPMPRLTIAGWTDRFVIARTDGSSAAFIMQEEVSPKVTYLGDESEFAKLNQKHLAMVDGTYNVGLGHWQNIVKATLS